MPSSGYGIENLFPYDIQADPEKYKGQVRRLMERVYIANHNHMFIEWLESFIAAWNQTHDVDIASYAGLEEWDL